MHNEKPRRVEPTVQIAVTQGGRIVVTCTATADFNGIVRTTEFSPPRDFNATNEGEQAMEFVRDMAALAVDRHEEIFAKLETEYHQSLGCAGPLPPPKIEPKPFAMVLHEKLVA